MNPVWDKLHNLFYGLENISISRSADGAIKQETAGFWVVYVSFILNTKLLESIYFVIIRFSVIFSTKRTIYLV